MTRKRASIVIDVIVDTEAEYADVLHMAQELGDRHHAVDDVAGSYEDVAVFRQQAIQVLTDLNHDGSPVDYTPWDGSPRGEYLRGQIELIADLFPDPEEDDGAAIKEALWDEVKPLIEPAPKTVREVAQSLSDDVYVNNEFDMMALLADGRMVMVWDDGGEVKTKIVVPQPVSTIPE